MREAFAWETCTVCKSYYDFTFLRRFPPPVHWENIESPEICITSQKCLSLVLLLLSSYSPLLARTKHFNFKEKPFPDVLHFPVLGHRILQQPLRGAPLSQGPLKGPAELGRPSAVLLSKWDGKSKLLLFNF